MGLFFNKKQSKKGNKNLYLDDQKSVFETKGEIPQKVEEKSYDEFAFKKKEYPTVPKYRAFDEKKVDVVVDRDSLGYQELNPEVTTVDLQKSDLYDDLHEIVNNAPVDDTAKEIPTSIYDESLNNTLKKDDSIEVIEIDNKELMVSDVVEQNLEMDKKLSIFGNADEPIQARVYEVKEAPVSQKIEIIDVDLQSEIKEPGESIKLNEDGKKVCPQCGAPCDPVALNCFLCGNKF